MSPPDSRGTGIISRVAYGGERVVISRNGKAQVAVIPLADLDRLEQLDEQREARRRRAAQAVADIQAASTQSGVSELTEEENRRRGRRDPSGAATVAQAGAKVKAVIDTNVLVSGLLKQGTPPAEVVADVLAGVLVVLHDQHILDEYRDVLARPKLGIDPAKAEAVLEFIVAEGIDVRDAHFAGQLPDPDDQPFADVAFTGEADG